MNELFEAIESVFESIKDTVMLYGNSDLLERCEVIEKTIEECNSFISRDEDIPEEILKNLIRLFGVFLALYRLLEKGGNV